MDKLLTLTAITLLTIGLHQLKSDDSLDYQLRFENYTQKYGKSYSPAEKLYRQQVYAEKMMMIEAHNADLTQTYTMGENQFTDLTQEEFVGIYLTRQSFKLENVEKYIPTNAPADSADWSNLTNVKNQGQCGSCWAFAAVGGIESYWRVNVKPDVEDLSEQQIVDCDRKVNDGCNGGFENYAIIWAAQNGIQYAKNYQYVGKQQTCKISSGPIQPNGVRAVSASDMKSAITNYPITVAVDATNWSPYKGGVFNNCKKSLNHAVLGVGFFEDGTWLIKNSWAASWGEKGFIRLAAGNTCGVQDEPYQAY